jgi:dipeptidyl-peptidase-4
MRNIALAVLLALPIAAQSPPGEIEAHWMTDDAFWFVQDGQMWKYEPVTMRKTRLEQEPAPDHPAGRVVNNAKIVGPPPARETMSPDGKWFAGGGDGNLYRRSVTEDRAEPLTVDGTPDNGWDYAWDAIPLWSPNSRFLVARRTDRRNSQSSKYPIMHWLKEPTEVEWVSLDPGGLISRYGFIDTSSGKVVPIDAGAGIIRVWAWRPDSSELLISRTNGGQIDVLAASPATGIARLLLTERTDTFLDVTLTLPNATSLTPLPEGSGFLWLSERDGWNRIYRYDYSGALVRILSEDQHPVERIVKVSNGWVYFTARAIEGRPYDIHLWRTSIDGGKPERLTVEPGQHDIPSYDSYLGARGAGIQFSPSGRFFLDTNSDINRPTETDLRRADGGLIEVLSKGVPSDGIPAQEFRVKAADGVTDLYGVIYRPSNFDPDKSYPVLDFLYAGPQMTRVPRLFGTDARERALANLGLITVVLDARGTPGRGKAFQDVGYRDIGRYEIADHVAALRQLATKYSWIDANRAAVLGGSLGGYFAVRAMLQAPDFFKVGIAMAPADTDGLRLWMGTPGDNKEGYEFASNLPLASNLRGRLLLIHGTSDLNAKFTSTIRLIDALVRANKPYDLILMPEQDHRAQGSPYVFDAIERYLTEHLYLSKTSQRGGLDYIWIPPGTFLMGCSRGDTECFKWEEAPHPVVIAKGFWIGRTEVTQKAWKQVMGTNPSRYRDPAFPVDQVSWFDASAYCEHIGMRLPTAQEWEYAARAGNTDGRYGDVGAVAWFDGNSGDSTHAVAHKLPNGFGLYDMLGNVWEWVQDDYTASGHAMKTLRGGSFFNLAGDLRASSFLWAAQDTAHRDMGVRCAGSQ